MFKSVFISLVTLILFVRSLSIQEAPDGSVCFNSCSGHGECKEYTCYCHAGYDGDDCSHTFGDSTRMLPILSVGDFNMTRKNFTQLITRNKFLLVGFSSYTCHKCIVVEKGYQELVVKMKILNVPFGSKSINILSS